MTANPVHPSCEPLQHCRACGLGPHDHHSPCSSGQARPSMCQVQTIPFELESLDKVVPELVRSLMSLSLLQVTALKGCSREGTLVVNA